ncbi:MAG: hypothetical protein ABIJ83_03205, partial [Patescibacteria group bacterium]
LPIVEDKKQCIELAKKDSKQLTEEEQKRLQKFRELEKLAEVKGEILKKRMETIRKEKDFVNAENLTKKIKDLKEQIDEAGDEQIKIKLLGKLKRRLDYTQRKINEGLVNFGYENSRLSNVYELNQKVSEALVYKYNEYDVKNEDELRATKDKESLNKINKKLEELKNRAKTETANKEIKKRIEECERIKKRLEKFGVYKTQDVENRIKQFLDFRGEKTSSAQFKEKTKKIIYAVLTSAGFATAGYAIRDLVIGDGQVTERMIGKVKGVIGKESILSAGALDALNTGEGVETKVAGLAGLSTADKTEIDIETERLQESLKVAGINVDIKDGVVDSEELDKLVQAGLGAKASIKTAISEEKVQELLKSNTGAGYKYETAVANAIDKFEKAPNVEKIKDLVYEGNRLAVKYNGKEHIIDIFKWDSKTGEGSVWGHVKEELIKASGGNPENMPDDFEIIGVEKGEGLIPDYRELEGVRAETVVEKASSGGEGGTRDMESKAIWENANNWQEEQGKNTLVEKASSDGEGGIRDMESKAIWENTNNWQEEQGGNTLTEENEAREIIYYDTNKDGNPDYIRAFNKDGNVIDEAKITGENREKSIEVFLKDVDQKLEEGIGATEINKLEAIKSDIELKEAETIARETAEMKEAIATERQFSTLVNNYGSNLSEERISIIRDLANINKDRMSLLQKEEQIKFLLIHPALTHDSSLIQTIKILDIGAKSEIIDYEDALNYYNNIEKFGGDLSQQEGLVMVLKGEGSPKNALSKLFGVNVTDYEIKSGGGIKEYVIKNVNGKEKFDMVVRVEGDEVKFGINGPMGFNWPIKEGFFSRLFLPRLQPTDLTNANIGEAKNELDRLFNSCNNIKTVEPMPIAPDEISPEVGAGGGRSTANMLRERLLEQQQSGKINSED